jgi:hypothetical protein
MVEQQIREGLDELAPVKRWIENDIEAGDDMIQVHADSLERAVAKFEQAAETARRLAELEDD